MMLNTRRDFIEGILPLTLTLGALRAAGENTGEPPPAPKPPPAAATTRHDGITVHCVELGHLCVNCYFVADAARNCVVIDPGAEPGTILDFIRRHRFTIKAWLLTHSHLDHISALDECCAAIPAPVAMHPEENDWAFCEKNQWEPHYPLTKEVTIERPLAHWQQFTDGALQYTVLHTPGHSAGSVCFWFPKEKIVFSGDTLFAGTVGRTDLHKSSFRSLLRSLGAFLAMPPETVVYAGHGKHTTVRAEIETNPFFKHTPDKQES
jgi:hydroxyacylglutathione hydrolase